MNARRSSPRCAAAAAMVPSFLLAVPVDESIGRTDIDPMIFAVGVGYRF